MAAEGIDPREPGSKAASGFCIEDVMDEFIDPLCKTAATDLGSDPKGTEEHLQGFSPATVP